MKSKYAAILVTCSSLMLGMTGTLPAAAEELPVATFATEENNNQQTTQQSTPKTGENNSEIDEMLDKIFSNEEYVQRMFDRIHQTYSKQNKGGKGFRMQNPQLKNQANSGTQTAPESQTAPENQTAPESQTAPENQTAPESQTEPENQAAPESQTAPENQAVPGGDSTLPVPGNGQMPRRHRRFGNSQSPWEMQSPQNGLLMSASSDAV